MITTEDNGKVITAENITEDNYYFIHCKKHDIAFDGFVWIQCPLCGIKEEIKEVIKEI